MNMRFMRDLVARDPWAMARFVTHLPNLVRLHWRLLCDRRVSLAAKAVLLAGVAYFVMPLDLIPDYPLIGLGWLDDVVVLTLTAQTFMRLCPPRVVQEHVRLIDEGG
jgi:uncharacterized membrane protein YkvA (DUF1232 family)